MTTQRQYLFLVVLLLILAPAIKAQQQIPLFGQKSPHRFSFSENKKNISVGVTQMFTPAATQNNFTAFSLVLGYSFPVTGITEKISPDLATKDLPFFCKKEYQFERATMVHLRFRLGSLDYVNQLEGKEKKHFRPGGHFLKSAGKKYLDVFTDHY